MTWWQSTAVAGGMLALAVALLTAIGRDRWRRDTGALLRRLQQQRKVPQPMRFDMRELEGLSAPVQRFFRAALSDGAPMVTAVTLIHTGSFNLGEQADRWRPFASTQQVVTRRPGFVWNARIALLPGLGVRVHDAYIDTGGILRAALLGLFTLIDLRGGEELAQGELMRWLAEAPWYPSALLPSQGVGWQAVDDVSARATLSDGPRSVSLTFIFGDDGLIKTVRADARARAVAGRMVPTPWEGRWSDYRLHDGMQVPTRGEVVWLLPQREKAYWRGTVVSARYEFAAGAQDVDT